MLTEHFSEEERAELVKYGLARGKTILLSILVILILGYFFGVLWQSIIFYISFCSLRRYAGGFHAESQGRCYAISLVILIISILCMKYANCSIGINILLQATCLVLIFILAPIENKNRKLDDIEQKQYKKKTRANAVVISLMCCFLYWKKNFYIIVPVVIAYIVFVCLLVAGYIKNVKENS